MKSLFLLFNHALTPPQEADARASLGVADIHEMPESLRGIWGQVPAALEAIADYLSPVRDWLSETARPGDYVLIQGDFGATCHMVRFAFDAGLIPVYATTIREAAEEIQPDGTVRMTHHFKHRIFRRYGE